MKIKLSAKISAGFISVIIVSICISISNYSTFNEITRRNKETALLNRVVIAMYQCRRSEKDFIVRKDTKYIDDVKKVVSEANQIADDAKNLFHRQEMKLKTDEIKANIVKYNQAFDAFVAMCRQGDGTYDTLSHLQEEKFKMSLETMRDAAHAWEKVAKSILSQMENDSERAVSNAQSSVLWGMLIGVAISLLFSFLLTRNISQSIRKVVRQISAGVDETTAASSQVSSASQQLAEGASEQAASIEETSASVEELASMTKRNSENAQTGNTKAGRARQVTEQSVTDMAHLNEAMAQMAKIIKSIDEIAFQTNILALNAAVEAARAGEAGMGFAVVADEVRNLAKRSADAAKDTSEKIEQGVQLTGKVKGSLDQMVEEVREVDRLMAEIATASKEQAQGIDQINTAVSQMDKVTQSTAASAEETASASEEMNAQALTMKESVAELITLVDGQNKFSDSIAHHMTASPSTRVEISLPKKTERKKVPAPLLTHTHKKDNVTAEKIIPLDGFKNM